MENKKVGGHTITLILRCGHEILVKVNQIGTLTESLEAVIYTPHVGDMRYCITHERQSTIVRVGVPVWNDANEDN